MTWQYTCMFYIIYIPSYLRMREYERNSALMVPLLYNLSLCYFPTFKDAEEKGEKCSWYGSDSRWENGGGKSRLFHRHPPSKINVFIFFFVFMTPHPRLAL